MFGTEAQTELDDLKVVATKSGGRNEIYRLGPLLADSVAEVENRTTPKISRKLIFRLPCRCNAL
jgi:hypothetical protein